MGRKQDRELKQAMGNMNVGEMLKMSEQNDFRILSIIGFMNRLAMLTTQDNPFFYLSNVTKNPDRFTDEDLAALTAQYIVIHDDAGVSGDGTESYPVVASINGRDENGKLNVSYADSLFGSVIHCRLILDEHNPFITVFCEGSDKTILVTDGEWFTA